MKEFDRIMGILLILQGQRTVSARQLAERFGVATRTIYRDLQTMSLLGIPIYTERGRNGGVRLLAGYFLPPLMFTREEATALLLGLLLLRNLRAVPFRADVETASQKLLAAVPDRLRATLAGLERVLGVERAHDDIFHGEPASPDHPRDFDVESDSVTVFLRALVAGQQVRLRYQSPYRPTVDMATVRPLGVFWDRDRWYLVCAAMDTVDGYRLWRADRVIEMTAAAPVATDAAADVSAPPFDVATLLDHAWLRRPMDRWRSNAPVRIRITREQAERLQRDWYYRLAQYDAQPDESIILSFGEDDEQQVLALVRWLGPGAELLAPESWRQTLQAQLAVMLRQAAPEK